MLRSTLIIAGLSLASVAAAVPLEITHQGRILNAAGDPLNGLHVVGVSLLGAPPSSPLLWSELFTVTVENGYFSVRLGASPDNPLDDAWFQESVWVRTSFGGLTTTEHELAAVPFSMQSHSVTGGTADVSEVRVGGQLALVGPDVTECDASTRGAMHFVPGDGVDTADSFEGCVVDLEGGYAWTPIGEPIYPELYEFSTHTFSTCGATGRNGPALNACRATYSTTWDETEMFGMTTSGIQRWTVPRTGQYRIIARGAAGGRNTSSMAQANGAEVEATVQLEAGQVLQLMVGQRGESNATHGNESGGGGGTFVVTSSNVPLVVAGGAGGAPSTTYGTSCSRTISTGHGRAETSGSAVVCSSYSALGGTNGNGGQTSGSYQGGAGGGFMTAGQAGTQHCSPAPGGGAAFVQGGVGGNGAGSCYSPKPNGGFGGGGAGGLGTPGGGGGYSGGGVAGAWSSYSNYGGGGGSYTVPTATGVVMVPGANDDEGSITIIQL